MGPTTLWRAEDEVLARHVAVRVLDLGRAGTEAGERFIAAAQLAGRVTGPQVASVLDAASEPGTGTAYVVAEWVDGEPLDLALRDGPLEPARAATVTRAVGTALAAAHARGVHARRLHPGQVLLCPGGGVKLTDLEVAAAVRGLVPVEEEGGDPVVADTEDLGRLLHAALTATWPGPTSGPRGWSGLPATPTRDGLPRMPRQVRAGLPRETDAVVAGVLEPARRGGERPLRTPRAVADALAPWAAAAAVSGGGPAAPAGGAGGSLLDHALETGDEVALRPRRRWPGLLLMLVVLIALGAGAWSAGLVVGRVPNPKTTAPVPRVPGQASASAGAPAAAGPITLAAVTSFDPDSDDKTENEAAVADAHDGDATTSWTTEHYLTPGFGNLKDGVGLLVDLQTAQSVARVVVDAPAGQQLQLYAAEGAEQATAAPTSLDALTAVTTSTAAVDGDTTLAPSAATTARYWVVWITALPMDPSGDRPDPGHPFSGRIAEMAFYPTPLT